MFLYTCALKIVSIVILAPFRSLSKARTGLPLVHLPACCRALDRSSPLCYVARMSFDERLKARIEQVEQGGAAKYHTKNRELGKLFARERISLLLDQGSFFEDAKLANNADPELPSDGVITGLGRIEGRPVAVMANDSTVKAGTWGRPTVEESIRIQVGAPQQRWPLFYPAGSAARGRP